LSNFNIRVKNPARWFVYYAIMLAILWFAGKEQQFIYFKF